MVFFYTKLSGATTAQGQSGTVAYSRRTELIKERTASFTAGGQSGIEASSRKTELTKERTTFFAAGG
ncbi:hypothetical protein TNCT_695561 [Trichonephila clavata]|uniref:Uncharacterized protein n=1 Tax=Trichonephila clavata TaxID=2740835 RepID=A0A8X6LLL8_TRICU|nr:hypothetical protein TNCT_695561 [Trichonephila clavata]